MLKGLELVVIVSGHEGQARMDRLAAGNAGASSVQIFGSGAQALEYLGANNADIVICDDQLNDMTGREFVARLRLDPVLSLQAVLMASGGSEESDVLEALAAGCSGYLVRPYSQEAFERQTRLAMQSCSYPGNMAVMFAKARARRNQDDPSRRNQAAVLDPVDTVNERHPARRHYKLGQLNFMNAAYRRAAAEFRKAIDVNRFYAEAYEGLARACRGMGDERGYLDNLKRAMEIFADQERFLETRNTFLELRKAREFPVNPFYEKGISLWKDGDYPEAILSWRRAVKLTPASDRVVSCLAWAYNIVGERAQAVEVLHEALAQYPGLPKAGDLLYRLTGQEAGRPENPLRNMVTRGLSTLRRAVGRNVAENAA